MAELEICMEIEEIAEGDDEKHVSVAEPSSSTERGTWILPQRSLDKKASQRNVGEECIHFWWNALSRRDLLGPDSYRGFGKIRTGHHFWITTWQTSITFCSRSAWCLLIHSSTDNKRF